MFNPFDVVSSDLSTVFWIALFAAIAFLAKSLYASFPRAQADQTQGVPPSVRLTQRPILTDAEAKFYQALQGAVGNHYAIFPQLPLWTLIQAKSNGSQAVRTFNNRINQKRVDFVLVDRISLATWVVIELDDPSHERESRRIRDAFVATVLEQSGLKLVRFRTASTYTPQRIRAQLGLNSPREISV